MKVFVQLGDTPPEEVVISQAAMDVVRSGHNPSHLVTVDRVKLLCAALLSEADVAASTPEAKDEERRCAGLAKINIEVGSMYIVKAVTTPDAIAAAKAAAAQAEPAPAATGGAA